jgi:8-oxo-dGTP pyrophosphatase MutT (NUDIX family)
VSAPEPVRRQRLAAYAVLEHDGRILLTQLSHRTGWPGGWTLPGGGVDHGENPYDTVVRETYEETGQHLSDPVLVDVESDHFEGVSPAGVLEDFHAVRLLFTATIADPTEPVVHDVGGTTSAARWVPLEETDGLDLVQLARTAVTRLRAGR